MKFALLILLVLSIRLVHAADGPVVARAAVDATTTAMTSNDPAAQARGEAEFHRLVRILTARQDADWAKDHAAGISLCSGSVVARIPEGLIIKSLTRDLKGRVLLTGYPNSETIKEGVEVTVRVKVQGTFAAEAGKPEIPKLEYMSPGKKFLDYCDP